MKSIRLVIAATALATAASAFAASSAPLTASAGEAAASASRANSRQPSAGAFVGDNAANQAGDNRLGALAAKTRGMLDFEEVAEPGGWALLFSCLGLIGLMVRRGSSDIT